MELIKLIEDLQVVMSATEIAHKIDVHWSAIYRWKSGQVTNISKLNYDNLLALRHKHSRSIAAKRRAK